MGDLDMLVDMGFDKERSSLALKKSGNLQGAIDWLEKNQDKSLDDIKAEDEAIASTTTTKSLDGEQQAQSLVCNECGKKFRTHVEAEFHATKTEHTDFSESTDEIAPLTEEERKAKLETLRVKLAAKRAEQSEQEKAERKKNEEIRRKSTKEGQDIKDALQQKERIKEAEKKRKEKQADILAKKRILEQLAADKAERKRKADEQKAIREGKTAPVVEEAPKPAAPSAPKPAAAYTEARLRLQTPESSFTRSFPAETTLFEVAFAVKEEANFEPTSFTTNFPKKVFDNSDFGMTLKEAGMVPSAALIVR